MNDCTSKTWQSIDLSGFKKKGQEYHGACPVTGGGRDCFWIIPDRELLGCRACSDNGGGLTPDQFASHLTALGLGAADGDGAGDTTFEWVNPLTGETVTQRRRRTGEPKYLWPRGTKTGALAYLARYDPDSGPPGRVL